MVVGGPHVSSDGRAVTIVERDMVASLVDSFQMIATSGRKFGGVVGRLRRAGKLGLGRARICEIQPSASVYSRHTTFGV